MSGREQGQEGPTLHGPGTRPLKVQFQTRRRLQTPDSSPKRTLEKVQITPGGQCLESGAPCVSALPRDPWCWRKLLRVPWTARRSNQSILKEINPGCSLERLMLKLKLQSFGHLMRRVDSLEKTLMLGGFGGRRRRG